MKDPTERSELPAELRKELGLPSRGPLPRAVAMAPLVRRVDAVTAKAVPRALATIARLATSPEGEAGEAEPVGLRRLRLDAARYLIDRALGTPAQAESAPADDRSLPVLEGDGVDAALRAALREMPEPVVRRMRDLWLEGLRATGRVVPGADGAAPPPSTDADPAD